MVPLLNRQVASRASVQPARLQLPLLDPQVAREPGIVALHLRDEALGVLAPDERLDGIAERMVGAGADVDDRRQSLADPNLRPGDSHISFAPLSPVILENELDCSRRPRRPLESPRA